MENFRQNGLEKKWTNVVKLFTGKKWTNFAILRKNIYWKKVDKHCHFQKNFIWKKRFTSRYKIDLPKTAHDPCRRPPER